ncbi:hypothetical protein [Streptomyces sp. WMMB303]|uniref:hypothetical protein n=1 Tax=Streptomyces sp. WMMB303 TaxID=3034154 RepID=UPI0023EB4AD0|nr:hypothetical protein [Streptomyces sp. WMMB303]MDF4252697.1 hypothetical protein [Streptomyces sp. WMMB303]
MSSEHPSAQHPAPGYPQLQQRHPGDTEPMEPRPDHLTLGEPAHRTRWWLTGQEPTALRAYAREHADRSRRSGCSAPGRRSSLRARRPLRAASGADGGNPPPHRRHNPVSTQLESVPTGRTEARIEREGRP